jgi:acetyl-CoA hydrolase
MAASDTLRPEQADVLDFFGYAAGGAHRQLADAGRLDILPSHYSHLPGLIRGRAAGRRAAAAGIKARRRGPPQPGPGARIPAAVLAKARVVIAEVNPAIPWTHGGPYLQAGDFALLVDAEHPPLDQPRGAIGAAEQAIARHIAGLIEDGATLQLGVGNLPEAVLAALHGHRDLGLHTAR